jgi:hypothetical protein
VCFAAIDASSAESWWLLYFAGIVDHNADEKNIPLGSHHSNYQLGAAFFGGEDRADTGMPIPNRRYLDGRATALCQRCMMSDTEKVEGSIERLRAVNKKARERVDRTFGNQQVAKDSLEERDAADCSVEAQASIARRASAGQDIFAGVPAVGRTTSIAVVIVKSEEKTQTC